MLAPLRRICILYLPKHPQHYRRCSHKENTLNSISASGEGNALLKDFAMKARIIRTIQSHYPLGSIHLRIIIHKEKKFLFTLLLTPLAPDAQKPKTSTNQKTHNPHQPQRNPDLRANQAIQELGAGKEQKAPNRNRLTWDFSSREA